jgi:hypothetical protein
MCRSRHSHDVTVEVAEDVVYMVEVVKVNVVLVVVGVAMSTGGAKKCAICMTELQLMTFCTLRGTVGASCGCHRTQS